MLLDATFDCMLQLCVYTQRYLTYYPPDIDLELRRMIQLLATNGCRKGRSLIERLLHHYPHNADQRCTECNAAGP